ncbi:MAG: hypothetical protein N2Z58_00990 [Fervidobacterium sp.]|nr:hypothetical protein [Fervidobacterium sp.]
MRNLQITATLVFLLIVIIPHLNFPVQFFFNTKEGMGIYGKIDAIEYIVGYPYSEIGFATDMDKDGYLRIGIYSGVDFLSNSYQLSVKPTVDITTFELSFPLTMIVRNTITNEATEVGRTYISIVPSWTLQNKFKVQFAMHYSALYLWYDPAFGVSIPTVKTDQLLRTKIDFKLTYFNEFLSLSIGYSALIRWLSYRSTFITGDNTVYFEGRFKISF